MVIGTKCIVCVKTTNYVYHIIADTTTILSLISLDNKQIIPKWATQNLKTSSLIFFFLLSIKMRIKTDKSQFEMEDEDVEKNKEETIETEITTVNVSDEMEEENTVLNEIFSWLSIWNNKPFAHFRLYSKIKWFFTFLYESLPSNAGKCPFHVKFNENIIFSHTR